MHRWLQTPWFGGRSPATWPPRHPCSPWRSGSPVMAQCEASLTSRARCRACGVGGPVLSGLHAVGTAQEGTSNPGSGMGAAGRRQPRSEAVIVSSRKPLTCSNVIQQRFAWLRAQFASRGSGVQIPSAPPESRRSAACCISFFFRSRDHVRFWERGGSGSFDQGGPPGRSRRQCRVVKPCCLEVNNVVAISGLRSGAVGGGRSGRAG